MTQVSEIFSIVEEQKKQDIEFLEKVSVRNEKEAKIIITKYDLKHPSIKIITDNLCNYDKIVEESKLFLQKRKEFLDFIAEYL